LAVSGNVIILAAFVSFLHDEWMLLVRSQEAASGVRPMSVSNFNTHTEVATPI
jgi:hypothetical protein